ncbi:MAG: methyltransferase [Pyrinomonadaceae bacterium]
MTSNRPLAAAQTAGEQPTASTPDAALLQMAGGAFVSQALYVAAKLGIADLLADGPQSVEYLSVATSTHELSLYRVLRALASVGAFVETEGRRFANSPVSEMLRSDHPRSMRDGVIWLNEEPHWRVYGHLMHSVRTGEPAWDLVHGEPVFQYLFETNKELGAIFNRAMTSYSSQTIGPILDAYDFAGAGVIADIAGGYGHLLAAVLEANPGARGILFDLPSVLAGAHELLESHGVADRVSIVSGDFVQDVPVVADVYLLKHIIHDWYDERDRIILCNIRKHMPANARLLILDAVIPEGNVPHFAKLLDLEMLLVPGGIERTESQFRRLLENSGFRVSRIIPTAGPIGIVEAIKA